MPHHRTISHCSAVPLGCILEASRGSGRACRPVGGIRRRRDAEERPPQPVEPGPLPPGYLMDQHRSSGDYHSKIRAPGPRSVTALHSFPVVCGPLAGGRAAFIAYGQSGSGKSSTLLFHEAAEGARA